MSEDAFGAFSRDDFAQTFDAGAADIGDAAKLSQKALRGFWADAWNFEKRGGGLAFRTALPMKGDGEAMRFIANLLNEMKNRRMAIEDDGFVFLAVDKKNFFFLGDARERLIDNLRRFQGLCGSVKLA